MEQTDERCFKKKSFKERESDGVKDKQAASPFTGRTGILYGSAELLAACGSAVPRDFSMSLKHEDFEQYLSMTRQYVSISDNMESPRRNKYLLPVGCFEYKKRFSQSSHFDRFLTTPKPMLLLAADIPFKYILASTYLVLSEVHTGKA